MAFEPTAVLDPQNRNPFSGPASLAAQQPGPLGVSIMVEPKHQKKVIALIVGGIIVVNSEQPSTTALAVIALAIVSFCISTCASMIKRTPQERSIGAPRYNTKDKFEIGGTICGYIFSILALLTFTFNTETTVAWAISIILFIIVIITAVMINMNINKNRNKA